MTGSFIRHLSIFQALLKSKLPKASFLGLHIGLQGDRPPWGLCDFKKAARSQMCYLYKTRGGGGEGNLPVFGKKLFFPFFS